MKKIQISEEKHVSSIYFQNDNGNKKSVCLPQLTAYLFLNNVENNEIPVDFAVTEFDLFVAKTFAEMYCNPRNNHRRWTMQRTKYTISK